MGDFAQNGFVTTYNFGTKSVQQFEEELKTFSGTGQWSLFCPVYIQNLRAALKLSRLAN